MKIEAILLTVVAIGGAILAATCSRVAPTENVNRQDRRATAIYYVVPFGTNATEFRLRDGTRCVLASSGGVTCQWNAPAGAEAQ